MKEYTTLKEAMKMIVDASGGQRTIVRFSQENRNWVFWLDNNIRIKMLAI